MEDLLIHLQLGDFINTLFCAYLRGAELGDNCLLPAGLMGTMCGMESYIHTLQGISTSRPQEERQLGHTRVSSKPGVQAQFVWLQSLVSSL